MLKVINNTAWVYDNSCEEKTAYQSNTVTTTVNNCCDYPIYYNGCNRCCNRCCNAYRNYCSCPNSGCTFLSLLFLFHC